MADQNKQDSFSEQMQNFNNTPDTTADYTPADIEKNKVMAVLAYFGILVLVPMFAAKDSPYAQYHANQGLVLFIAAIAVSLAAALLALIPVVGWILAAILPLVPTVFMVLGIINAAGGKAKELPFIGKYQILK